MRRTWVPVAAGLWNLVFNGVFIAQQGIGTAGIVFIVATTVLCLVIAVLLARRPKPLV